jgi:hypothetical protein
VPIGCPIGSPLEDPEKYYGPRASKPSVTRENVSLLSFHASQDRAFGDVSLCERLCVFVIPCEYRRVSVFESVSVCECL